MQTVEVWSTPVPEAIFGLLILALAAAFVVVMLRDRSRPAPVPEIAPDQAEPDSESGDDEPIRALVTPASDAGSQAPSCH